MVRGPSLSTARWILAGALGLLSAAAIAATAGRSGEESSFMRHVSTDIREPGLIFGSAGLGGLMVFRSASVFLPKPWRLYIDRLEFTFVTMLWILWTSATMAFSASAISKTICRTSSGTSPSCSVLTFDLVLLHLLSTACFAYLVVVLSTALSPGYFASHSPSLEGLSLLDRTELGSEGGDVFVMWDMAMGDSPKGLSANLPTSESTYGSASTVDAVLADSAVPFSVSATKTTDRYARGRAVLYTPLLLSSLATIASFCALLSWSSPGFGAMAVLLLAAGCTCFTSFFLLYHRKQTGASLTEADAKSRGYRAIELAGVLALFLLWPVAATAFTANPSSSAHPCSAQTPDDAPNAPPGSEPPTGWLSPCNLTLLMLSLSWTCGWLALARAVHLVFPMLDSPDIPVAAHSGLAGSRSSGEAAPLIPAQASRRFSTAATDQNPAEVVRPQVKYGRLVAGEAFELGEADDDD